MEIIQEKTSSYYSFGRTVLSSFVCLCLALTSSSGNEDVVRLMTLDSRESISSSAAAAVDEMK